MQQYEIDNFLELKIPSERRHSIPSNTKLQNNILSPLASRLALSLRRNIFVYRQQQQRTMRGQWEIKVKGCFSSAMARYAWHSTRGAPE
jgi:hypothetical protein